MTVTHPAPRLAPTASRGRRMLLPLATAGAAAAGLVLLHLHDPGVSGSYLTCPFLALTGLYCPGCGTLRATAALTHGDVGGALGYNPFTVAAYVLMLLGYAAWTRRQWTGTVKTTLAPAGLLYALFWGILAFWVLRNVPGLTWLSPL